MNAITDLIPIPLPEGYKLLPPGMPMGLHPERGIVPLDSPVLRQTIPQYGLYGGATITQAADARGVEYIGCDARGPDGDFRYHVFELYGNVARSVPLQYRATGRGSIGVDLYSGRLEWIAWEGSQFYRGAVPGAQPFPSLNQQTSGAALGLVVCSPAKSAPAYVGQAFTGQQTLDLVALFDLPLEIKACDVRLSVEADTANVRGRLGGQEDPWQLTPVVQIADLAVSQNGFIYPYDG